MHQIISDSDYFSTQQIRWALISSNSDHDGILQIITQSGDLKMLEKNNTRRFLSIIVLLIVFASTLVLNVKTPMIGEDYALSLRYHEKVNSSTFIKLGLIYDKVSIQFNNWNSRLGEQLAILFLGFDKTFFNILNSLVFMCLAVFNVGLGLGDVKHISSVKLISYISITLMIYYVFLPSLGESVFWLTGSTNYLWGLVLLLLFLFPFIRLFETRTGVKDVLPIYYLLVGFLGGMTNENTVPISILLCLLAIFNLRLKKVPIHYTYYLGFLFHCLGFLLLIFSPSTKIRREYYDQVFGVVKPSMADYVDRLTNILTNFYKYYKIYLFVAVILLMLYIILHFLSNKNEFSLLKSRPMALVLFVFISFGTVFDMIAVPYYEVRSSLFVFFAITSLVVSLIDSFFSSRKPMFYLSIFLLSLFWLITINSMRKTYNTFESDFNKRESILLTNLGLKNTVVVPKFVVVQDQRLLNIREHYLVFNNWDYSAYYGLAKIEIK